MALEIPKLDFFRDVVSILRGINGKFICLEIDAQTGLYRAKAMVPLPSQYASLLD